LYLIKLANSVYYTRVCFPKTFVESGYPFDIKVSLLTKDRATATLRNLQISAIIKEAILVEKRSNPINPRSFRQFKEKLDSAIFNTRKHHFQNSDYEIHLPQVAQINRNLPENSNNHATSDKFNQLEAATAKLDKKHESSIAVNVALEQFIKTKENAKVTALTVHQLKQRISDFLKFLNDDKRHVAQITTRDLTCYVDELNRSNRSPKTAKEYLAAVKQFLRWCHGMQYLPNNPSESLKFKFNDTKKHASQERLRWSSAHLKRLFSSDRFHSTTNDFKWVTLLMLYHGLRPNEACQLRVADIKKSKDDIVYINVTDAGERQHLKNKHAMRMVPVSNHLIDSGFMAFVARRKASKQVQLFSYKPSTQNDDWSKQYRTQLGKILTSLGFRPKSRPTAYSFRHTFIDELKQRNVAEYEVAELVGHINSNMTYGRYGKNISLERLLQIVNLVELSNRTIKDIDDAV